MSSIEFINELAGRGIELWTQDGKLQYKAPKGAMTPSLVDELKTHKVTLIALLEQFAGTAGTYPLSFAQKSLWSLHQLNPDSAAYNVTYATRIDDDVEVSALRRCVDYLIARHPILRTVYRVIDGEPRQQVGAEARAQFTVDRVFAADDAAIRRWIDDESNRPFDLTQSPIRLKLLLNEQDGADAIRTVLLLNVHHIAADFWSLEILLNELRTLYRRARAGEPLKLPPLPVQYKDCVEHERARLDGGDGEHLAAFWRRELAHGFPVLNLATDRLRPPRKTEHGRVVDRPLGALLSRQVRDTARQLRVTPYMLLLAVYQLHLHLHTGQERLMIGAPTSGRNSPGSEAVVGHFVNTVVLACEVRQDDSFDDLLRRTREMMLRVLDHQDYPFPLLVDALRPARDPSRSPIYQVMYNWNQARGDFAAPGGSDVPFYRERLAASSTGTRGATHDLTLNVQDLGEAYLTAWTFNTDLFDNATIERFASQYAHLVGQVVADTTRPLHQYGLSAGAIDDTRNRIAAAHAFAGRAAHADSGMPRDAAHVAWQFDDRAICYGDVHDAVRALRAQLDAVGIDGGKRVELRLRSAAERAIALLAIRAVGARYVVPGETADAQVDAVCRSRGDAWSGWDIGAIEVVQMRHSAGRDDGVATDKVSAVEPLLDYVGQLLHLDADATALVLHGTHDWLAAATLAQAVLAGGAARLSERASIGALASGDPAIATLAQVELDRLLADGPSLILPALLLRRAHVAGIGRARALVAYGEHPHAVASFVAANRTPAAAYFVPMQCADTGSTLCAFVAEPNGWRLLAPSYPGRIELVLGSSGSFADDRQAGMLHFFDAASTRTSDPGMPLETAPQDRRLTATGVAVVRRDGDVLCADPSLRVARHRPAPIEIGAVEQAISAVPGVAETACACVVRDTQDMLVAYLVADSDDVDAEALENAVRSALKQALPDSMHPDAIMVLDDLLLDASGALDMGGLPPPRASETAVRIASNDIERKLAAIWADVLGLPSVGVDHDFFELGGDSILAAVIVSRAALDGMYLKPQDIFQHTTVASLSTVVREAPGLDVDQGPVHGEAALGPAAQWFVERVDVDRSHFNQALLVPLGEAPDANIMAEAIRVVVRHHDVLRSRFVAHGDGMRHVFVGDSGSDDADFSVVRCVDPAGRHCEPMWREAINATQSSLDIESGRLMAVRWLESASVSSSRLLIVVHHLAIDGVSWSILLQDLADCYLRLRARTAAALPLKTSSAKAWVDQWVALAQNDALDEDRRYWRRVGAQVRDALSGPKRVALMRHGLAAIVQHAYQESSLSCAITLDAELTHAFRTTAPRAYGTDANDLLIAALHAGFHAWSGSDALLVDVEGHGRDALGDSIDLSRSIGWFTSIYPVLIDTQAATSDPSALIKAVKARLREVPRKGASYGVLRYLDTKSQAGDDTLTSLPRAPILFTYLGQLEQLSGSSSLYSGSPEPAPGIRSPRQRRTHLLDVVAYVSRGRLTVESSFFGVPGVDESIGCLMCRVEEALTLLIRHCSADGIGDLTPDDVPQLDVDQDALDALLDEIDALER
ncbi:nonribosomal peptide synthase [Burkholderia lata]|uniref:Nonribosomal peptide synthase n=1 Tax=Burkholderia lata (strain ATCC 17760 / DSM 23089 / LMG 22485 / NCIMB 9086 / R18194 / 383) TaxID=482957 RepID=A0A6P3BQI8_BURL3|nr:condensation domain-containing protein [Burkholderia lata]VWD61770.1 nonribosomal peptide synthase [Burkholderia lata]